MYMASPATESLRTQLEHYSSCLQSFKWPLKSTDSNICGFWCPRVLQERELPTNHVGLQYTQDNGMFMKALELDDIRAVCEMLFKHHKHLSSCGMRYASQDTEGKRLT